ncbi:ribonuclease H-like protein [Panus rudis PR-1116 ss-1]|nr:ribonuclease H-like protein [Panus rudis PR-1116 ss-1]
MPKAKSSGGFYAVARGRNPGIYLTWEECEQQVKAFRGSRHKKFKTSHDAEAWIAQNGGPSNAASSLLASTSTSTTSTVERRSRPYPETRPMISKKGKERDEVVMRTEREGWLLVYCDGACKGNGKPGSIAGIGVWWGPDDPRNIAERCPGSQTNNRAELIAIVRVLQTTPLSKTPLQILTDSQYSMKCGYMRFSKQILSTLRVSIGIKEWLQKWKRNGYKNSKGKPVSNRAIIEYIDALLNERGALGQRVCRLFPSYFDVASAQLSSNQGGV